MDPLTAFGIVCNVIQIVDTGLQALSTCREIALHGSTSSNLDIEYTTGHIQDLSRDLSSSLTNSLISTHDLSTSDRQLRELAQKCEECAKDLLKKLEKLKVEQKSKKIQVLAKTIEVLWKRGTFTDAQNRLENLRRTLDTRILAKVYQKQEALALQGRSDFEGLSLAAQNILIKLVEGHRTVIGLTTTAEANTHQRIASESLTVRSKIENEHIHTRSQIQGGIRIIQEEVSQRQSQRGYESQIKQFKESLWFPAIYHRQQMIHDAHNTTFAWIFHDADKEPLGSLKQEHDNMPAVTRRVDRPYRIPFRSRSNSVAVGTHFRQWLRTGSEIYWVTGKPGSGKSTLINFLVQNNTTKSLVQQWAQSRKVMMLSFFFWNSGAPEEKNLSGFIRSVLYQCLDTYPELLILFITALKIEPPASGSSNTQLQIPLWTERQLKHVMEYIFKASAANFAYFLLIDGADELQEPYQDFLSFIKAFEALGHVKFCVSSRPLYDFERTFYGYPSFKLEDLTRNDMNQLIQDRLLDHANWNKLGVDIEEVSRGLVERAEGVFLWLVLALKELEQGLTNMDSAEELTTLLQEIPDELGEMYTRMIAKIKKRYRQDSAWFFHCLLFCSANQMEQWTSVLYLALAKNQDFLKLFDGSHDEISFDDNYHAAVFAISDACEATIVHLKTRCAGLLHIASDGRYNLQSEDIQDERCSPEAWKRAFHWEKYRVSFLHRTLKDFLFDSTVGAQLLYSSPSVNEHMVRAQYSASLAMLGISNIESLRYSEYYVSSPELSNGLIKGLLRMFNLAGKSSLDLQESFLTQMEAVLVSPVNSESSDQLGHLRWLLDDSMYGPQKDLLGLLSYMGFTEILRKKVSEAKFEAIKDLKTYLLSCALSGLRKYVIFGAAALHDDYEPPFKFIRDLTVTGADPNIVCSHPDDPVTDIYRSWHQYLAALCRQHLESDEHVSNLVDLLEYFIAAGADVKSPFCVSVAYPWFNWHNRSALEPALPKVGPSTTPLEALRYYANDRQWYSRLELVMIAAGATPAPARSPELLLFRETAPRRGVHIHILDDDCTAWSHAWSRHARLGHYLSDDEQKVRIIAKEVDREIMTIVLRATKLWETGEEEVDVVAIGAARGHLHVITIDSLVEFREKLYDRFFS